MGDLDGDGRAALVEAIPDATEQQRAAAFRVICRHATTRQDEDDLLWMAGLHYKPQPQEGQPE